ncbi:MAG: divergent polysaccharide deacetylase family protein [Candidatus Marinimicrobia bacterium]|nr:divergent polysaccharide deacetylase family protein [Candidatus Neomarinimicrobiota bacterium]
MKLIRYLKKPNKVIANRRKDEKRLLAAFIGVIWLLIIILIYFYPKSAPSRGIMHLEGRYFLNNTVRTTLAKNGFSEIKIDSDNSSGLFLAFTIPAGKSTDAAIEAIKPLVQHSGCTIRSINRFDQNRGFIIMVDYYNQSIGSLTFLQGENINDYLVLKGELRQKPKLAIVIDDFGYSNSEVIKRYFQVSEKLTLSVIPGHRYSRWAASEGKKFNKEIIVHMPMEPERQEYSLGEDQYMIRQTMRSFEVEQRISAAMVELPEAVGMNNHMGSLATADTDVMKMVIKSLKEKGLFFVDSFTSPRSVAYEVAKLQGLPSACRSVFLDNNKDKSEIQAQFEKAIEVAKRRGSAIAIGHVYLETLEVLERLIETGKFSGITLCFASEIVS